MHRCSEEALSAGQLRYAPPEIRPGRPSYTSATPPAPISAFRSGPNHLRRAAPVLKILVSAVQFRLWALEIGRFFTSERRVVGHSWSAPAARDRLWSEMASPIEATPTLYGDDAKL